MVTIESKDFEGYTALDKSVDVMVLEETEATMIRYKKDVVEPEPSVPGETE